MCVCAYGEVQYAICNHSQTHTPPHDPFTDLQKVALKFMREKDHFDREVQVRSAAFDAEFVIDILRTVDGTTGPGTCACGRVYTSKCRAV